MEPESALGLDCILADISGYIPDNQWRDHANRGDANIDDFYRLAAVVMAIGLQMARVECFGDFLQGYLVNRVRWNRDHELIGLTLVPGINRALEAPTFGRDAGAIEHGTSLLFQCQEGSF